MHRPALASILCLVVLAAISLPSSSLPTTRLLADEPTANRTIDYQRDVKPVLRQRCFACHGALKQEAGLRLDTVAAMRQGGDSGAAIEPGKIEASLLLERVASDDEFTRMPPEGEPLTAEQIASLRRWITDGAAAPDDERPEDDPRRHWAFLPPRQVALPSDSGETQHPVDALLAVGRQAQGLRVVEPADRGLLLRRVYLDLIGLPPTREQLRAFLADERPDAYERVVDQLLESPHYGERWGRHWMDVWRYTDWFGLGQQLRYSQKHIWHWRDWIVESLNEDRGYDQMVLAMLAADELSPTDQTELRATGFLARNYFLFNRTTWLDDTLEHTSKAFLGLTMNCAKCHDHKYDPISQVDYYRLRAIFEPHQVRLDPLPGETDLERDGLPRVFDAHPDEPTYVHIRGNEKDPDTSRVIEPGVPEWLVANDYQAAAVELPAEAHFPALQPFVLDDHLAAANRQIEQARSAVADAERKLAAARTAAEAVAQAATGESPPAEPVLADDFSKPRDDLWQRGPGEWKYEDGRVIQSETGAARRYLRSVATHPADFVAKLRFKTIGGEQWKSVGICFDAIDGREKMVYLSAVMPGSKIQVSFNTGGSPVYPPNAKQDRAVPLNQPIELQVAVRGKLVNASVDGQHALAFELPIDRDPGHIDLVAFDAVAEFDDFELRPLPPDFAMQKPTGDSAAPLTVADAELALQAAQAALTVAELRPDALRTAHAADRARHGLDSGTDVPQRILDAARAARRYEAAEAALALVKAEQELAAAMGDARAAAEKKRDEAEQRLRSREAAIEEPGEGYTSLRVSSKAAEGPAESEVSRRQAYPNTSTGRRTAFARWIVDRGNPLTARVAVNHIWLRHFGQPLVDSTFDFGLRSPRPVQQDLLDWLAVDLMENGWSMKRLHRLLVTSQAYRLASSTSDADPQTLAQDPDNQYYWRRRPARMESQVVRDSLLQLAGVLDPQLGGPTIDPDKNPMNYRRSLYFTHSRDSRDRFLSMFDDADILACYRRSESVVPQQALAMANSELSLTMARKIAERLTPEMADAPQTNSDDRFIAEAFETVLCRLPTAEEAAECRAALVAWTTAAEGAGPPVDQPRARANLVHVLLNHNDFVTIR